MLSLGGARKVLATLPDYTRSFLAEYRRRRKVAWRALIDDWFTNKYIFFALLLVVVTTITIVIYYLNHPQVEPMSDTDSYLKVVQRIQTRFQFVDAWRLPGYPVLIVLVYTLAGNGNLAATSIVQAVLFVLAVLELYIIAALLLRRGWMAFLIGLLTGTNLVLLSFIKPIESEALALFLLVSLALVIVLHLYKLQTYTLWLVTVIILMLFLTRAEWIYLPIPLFTYFLLIAARRKAVRRLLPHTLAALVVLYAILGNYIYINMVTNNFAGVVATQNLNAFGKVVEYRMQDEAPYQYAAVTKIVDSYLARGISDPYYILRHEPSLASHQEKLAGAYARAIIAQHPVEFLAKSAPLIFSSFLDFDSQSHVLAGPLGGLLLKLQPLFRSLYTASMIFPLCAAFWIFLLFWQRTRQLRIVQAMAAISLLVLYGHVLTTLGGIDSYTRLHTPYGPLLILLVWGTFLKGILFILRHGLLMVAMIRQAFQREDGKVSLANVLVAMRNAFHDGSKKTIVTLREETIATKSQQGQFHWLLIFSLPKWILFVVRKLGQGTSTLRKMVRTDWHTNRYGAFAILLLFLTSLVVVAYYFNHPAPEIQPDTRSYLIVLPRIQTQGRLVNAWRLPGYPLWILFIYALAGQGNLFAVSVGQAVLFVLATLELYVIAVLIFRRGWMAFLIGLLVGTNLTLLSYVKPIMSEGLALWLVVSLALAVVLFVVKRHAILLWVISLCLLALCLTRPEWIFLPVPLFIYLLIVAARHRVARQFIHHAIITLIIFYAIIGNYIYINSITNHYTGISGVQNLNALGKILQYNMQDEAPAKYGSTMRAIDYHISQSNKSPYFIFNRESSLRGDNGALAGAYAQSIITNHLGEYIFKSVPLAYSSLTDSSCDKCASQVAPDGPLGGYLVNLRQIFRTFYGWNKFFPFCCLFWIFLLIWRRTARLYMVESMGPIVFLTLYGLIITTLGSFDSYQRLHTPFNTLLLLVILGTFLLGMLCIVYQAVEVITRFTRYDAQDLSITPSLGSIFVALRSTLLLMLGDVQLPLRLPFSIGNSREERSLMSQSPATGALPFASVNRRIFRALLSLASAALLVRVMGMLYQIVVTARFGAGATMDAYFVAAAFPLLLSRLITDAMEYAVIPVYTRVRAEGLPEQTTRLFSTLFNLVVLSAIIITLLMLVFRQQFIFLSAPALGPYRAEIAVRLSLLLFPVFLVMILNGFLEAILNAEGQFGWPAYAGILVPLTSALLVLFLSKSLGVVTLAMGLLIGSLLQLPVCIVRARLAGVRYRAVIDIRNQNIKLVLLAAWPVLLAAFITQAGPFVDQIVASFLPAGSISAINYALKIVSVPVGIIFVSVGRAMLPYLSRQQAAQDITAFKNTLRLYLWIVGLSTTLLAVFMLLFARPLVQILFQRGAFYGGDTRNTAYTLMGFVIGLTPMSFGFLLSKALSALGKTRVLLYITLFSVAANAIFDIIFAHFWQSFGIALSTSAVYFCTMGILLLVLQRTVGSLTLSTPPEEFVAEWQKITSGYYSRKLIRWQDEVLSSWHISRFQRLKLVTRVSVAIICLAGVIDFLHHSLTFVRFTFGAFIVVLFLRFRYALLLAWVIVSPLIGSASPFPFFNGNHFLSDLIIPTLLLLLCLPTKQALRRMPALAILLIFLLWILTSIGFSPIGRGPFLNYWIIYVQYLGVGVLTICLLTTRERMKLLIDTILLMSAFITLFGIYEYLTSQHIKRDPYTGIHRMLSLFGSAPTLALFLSIVIPLALYRTFTLSGRKRIIGVLLTLFLCLGVLLSYTRSAYICIPLSILLMVFFLPSRKLKRIILGSTFGIIASLTLLAVVGHLPIFSRFFNKDDLLTLNGRIYLWQALLAHFDPTQILGRGFRASDVLLGQLRIRGVHGVIGTVAHNIFMEALYDHGIIGALILLAIFITLFISIIRGVRKALDDDHHLLFATTLATLFSTLVQSLGTNDLLTHLTIGTYFWIVMTLPFALYWSRREEPLAKTAMPLPTEDAVTEIQAVEAHIGLPGERLRICMFSRAFYPIVGGSEVQMARQAKRLQELGHMVTIVTLRRDKRWKKQEELDGIPVLRVGGIYRRNSQIRIGRIGHIPADIALFLTLWRLRHSYDLIHVFQALPPAATATLIGKITRKPVIIQIQNTGPDDTQRQQLEHGATLLADTLTNTEFLKLQFMDWAPGEGDITYLPYASIIGPLLVNFLRHSDAYYHILNSRGYRYLTSHGFRAEQIIHIPNGVDTEQFQPVQNGQHDPEMVERKIICVSRLEYAKGIDVLLHAWARMLQGPAEWRSHLKPMLLLAGDGKLRQKMEQIAVELNIQDSVSFLGTRADIRDLLQQSWGFVLASRWEGLPNAILEAMSCGLPCIVTRVSGNEDLITDGLNGLLVESEQPIALAEALHRLLEDAELAQRLGQQGRLMIVRNYQLSSIVERCMTLYRHVLTKGSHPLPSVLQTGSIHE